MKETKLKFEPINRSITFLGRNGSFLSEGLNIFLDVDNQTIHLQPITSKGDEGRCRIEIPITTIPELIKELTAMLPKKTYYVTAGQGRKWEVYFHNGIDRHADGSLFYGLRICQTKKVLNEFLDELRLSGFTKQ